MLVSRPLFGLGLGLTVIGLGLGLGLMKYMVSVSLKSILRFLSVMTNDCVQCSVSRPTRIWSL